MDLSNKKIVLLIAPVRFHDKEYGDTFDVLKKFNAQITIASKGVSQAESKQGEKVDIDEDISNIKADDFDSLVIIGGNGAHVYFDDNEIHSLAKTFLEQGKIVAAICCAPSILARAGLLKDKKATASPKYGEELTRGGATFTGQAVVVDGNIICGNGPDAALEFSQTIAKNLN